MDRRLIVLMGIVLALMGGAAAIVVLDRPAEHIVPLAGHLGVGRRPLPIEALLTAPVGLLLVTLFVALRMPQGGSEAAEQRRRWSKTFLAGVAVLFMAFEGAEVGALYGWFPASETPPRLLLAAAAIWLVLTANSAAKLIVLGRSGTPASSEGLRLNRFSAMIGLLIGVVLIPVSLWSPFHLAMTLWLMGPVALALSYLGRVLTLGERPAP